MVPTKEEAAFIEAAARLQKMAAHVDPKLWTDFIAGLSQYADRGISIMLTASQRLEYAQGYANARLHMLEHLSNCIRLAETIRSH
jgi:hypothetical protein